MNLAITSRNVSARWRESPVIHLFIFGLLLAGTAVGVTIITHMLVPPAPSPWHQWVLLKNLLLPVLLLAVYAATVRGLERRRASELALSQGLALFPVGLMVGITAISAYVLTLIASGMAHVRADIATAGILKLSNEFLAPWITAVAEELLFRAVLFRLAEKMFGTAAAVLISATLFGLAHAGNPGATPGSLFALSLGGGILLALAFAATRNLWFSIGLHMGWNMAEGFVYGLPDSGMIEPVHLAKTSITGPLALTGGAFGPEGSVIAVVVCLSISTVLLLNTVRSGRWIAAGTRWRQAALAT